MNPYPACGVSYISHRHILSTVEVQCKQLSHTAVCVCILFCQFLTNFSLFSANFTAINICGGVIWEHRSGNNGCYSIRDSGLSQALAKEMVIVLSTSVLLFTFRCRLMRLPVWLRCGVFFVVVGRVVVFLVVASIIAFLIRLSFLNTVAESSLFIFFPGYFLP